MKWLWSFFSLKGRIGRKPFWIFLLSLIATGFVAVMGSGFTGLADPEFIAGGYLLLTLWPAFAVYVKRWHDRDRSAWWFVLTFLGGLGVLVWLWILIECAFFSGSTEQNRFGPSPASGLNPVGEADRFQSGLITLMLGLVALGIFFHTYRLPAQSMLPTLQTGDFIIVDRTAYGIPMPFTNRQIKALKNPSRGDVVVFRYPKEPSVEYIKRVAGIPGDRIGYYEKTLYVNGEPAKQVHVGVYAGKGVSAAASGSIEYEEMLGDKKHKMLVTPETQSIEGDYLVQNGEYFVMGDNRDNSNDSRYWGMVPTDNLVGKASLIWMNWDHVAGEINWDRLGLVIQ
jgi:signal peptidase I